MTDYPSSTKQDTSTAATDAELAAARVPRRLPLGTFTHAKIGGVSLALGVGAVGNHGHTNRVAALQGIHGSRLSNFSVGGSVMSWQDPAAAANCGWSRWMQQLSASVKANSTRPYAPWAAGENHLCIVKGGEADLFSYASGTESFGTDPRNTIPRMVMALRTIISRCLAAYVVENASLTFSTGWATAATTESASGTGYSYTLTTDKYYEWTTPQLPPGSVVVLQGSAWTAFTNMTASFTLNGTAAGTLDVEALKPRTLNKVNGWVKRFKVGYGSDGEIDPYTATTIRCTFTGGANNLGVADSVWVETPLRWLSPVLVNNMAKFATNTVYMGSSVTDQNSIFDAANAAIAALVEEFAFPGLPNPVRLVDLDTPTNRNMAYYAPWEGGLGAGDGVHPNETGYGVWTEPNQDALIDWSDEVHDYAEEALAA